MTKTEYQKCVELMEEAIRKAKQADTEWDRADKYCAIMDESRRRIAEKRADRHYGEAIGINEVLVALGFKHDSMEELSELL